jgi:hypothetical protein
LASSFAERQHRLQAIQCLCQSMALSMSITRNTGMIFYVQRLLKSVNQRRKLVVRRKLAIVMGRIAPLRAASLFGEIPDKR